MGVFTIQSSVDITKTCLKTQHLQMEGGKIWYMRNQTGD